MALLSTIVVAGLATLAAADTADVAAGTISPQEIVDLSQDLVEDTTSIASSSGAAKVNEVAANDPFLRAAVVLENGKVVAKFYRNDPQVDPSEPHQLWSTTKSWTSLLVGLLVDEGKLSVDETLGEVFQDEAAWADVTDGTIDFRKDVTIHEMLSMTSGLVTPEEYSTETMLALPEDEVSSMVKAWLDDGGQSGGGTSLSHSLAFPEIGEKGEFFYFGLSQILSYVIKERSGMTPREYIAAKVMPALGISEDEYNWLQNADGVEFAFHGLEATALAMSKFGQLFLQGGQSKPPSEASETSRARSGENQLISKDWIDASFTPHAKDNTYFNMEYGYLWWIVPGGMYCTIGMYGQDTCVDPANGRVIVQQRDQNPNAMVGNLAVATAIASDPTLSFSAEETVQPDTKTDQQDSAAPAAVVAQSFAIIAALLLLL